MSHCENDDCAIDELQTKLDNSRIDYSKLETDFQSLQDSVSRFLNFAKTNTMGGLQPMLVFEISCLQEVYEKVKF